MSDIAQDAPTPGKPTGDLGKRIGLLAFGIFTAAFMVAWIGFLGWGALWVVGVV